MSNNMYSDDVFETVAKEQADRWQTGDKDIDDSLSLDGNSLDGNASALANTKNHMPKNIKYENDAQNSADTDTMGKNVILNDARTSSRTQGDMNESVILNDEFEFDSVYGGLASIDPSDTDAWTLWGESSRAISYGFNTAINETLDLVLKDLPSAFLNTDIGKAVDKALGGILTTTPENYADNQSTLDSFRLPTDLAPKTLGGKMGASVVQFITGFIGAGKIMKMGQAVSKTHAVGQAMAKGAVADFTVFDGTENRLSDLIQDYPTLQNPITEYLSTQQGDSELDGRFKNAIEGLGLGAVADGLLLSLKGLKEIRQARQQQASMNGNRYAKSLPLIAKSGTRNDPIRQIWEVLGLGSQYTLAKIAPASKRLKDITTEVRVNAKDLEKVLVQQADFKIDKNTNELVFKGKKGKGMAKITTKHKEVGIKDVVDFVKVSRDFEPRYKFSPATEKGSSNESWEWFIQKGDRQMVYAVQKETHTTGDDVLITIYEDVNKANDYSILRKEASVSNGMAMYPPKDTAEKSGMFNKSGTDTSITNVSKNLENVKLGDHQIVSASSGEAVYPAKDTVSSLSKSEKADTTRNTMAQGLENVKLGEHNINMNRIESVEDVDVVLKTIAGDPEFSGAISKAGRGTMTNEEIVQMADDMGLSVEDVINRRDGMAFNAETLVASRNLLVASSEVVARLAKEVAGGNASPTKIYEFKQAVAKHSGIQASVQGMTKEAGRALQSFRISAKATDPATMELMKAEIGTFGGVNNAENLARRIVQGIDNGENISKAVGDATRKGFLHRTKWTAMEWWINGLLSSPKTHLVNAVGNSGAIGLRMIETSLSATISNLPLIGSKDIPLSDAYYQLHGFKQGLSDAFKLVGKSWQEKQILDFDATTMNKSEQNFETMISASGVEKTIREIGIGRYKPFKATTLKDPTVVFSLDALGNLVRVPGAMLGLSDGFFKSINYRMGLAVESSRTAHREGFKGADFHNRVADLMNTPSDEMRKIAMQGAKEYTFTNDFSSGGLLEKISGASNQSALLKLFLPFIRTPMNLMKFSIDRSPLGIFGAQIMRKIAMGGAVRDETIAKLGAGSSLMLMAGFMADDGKIVGSGFDKTDSEKQALRRQGWLPYSYYHDGKYYELKRTDPFAMLLGLSADAVEIMRGADGDEETGDKVAEALIAGVQSVANNLTSKTWAKGVIDFSNIMNDPKRYLPQWAKSTVTSFAVPSLARSWVAMSGDGVVRDTVDVDFWDSVMLDIYKSLPHTADTAPPRLDIWGQEMTRPTGVESVIPINSKEKQANSVDSYLADILHWSPRKPSRRIDGVKLTAWQYYDYQRFSADPKSSGNSDATHIVPLYESLENLINNDAFKQLGLDDQKEEIKKEVKRYRMYGKQLVIGHNQDLANRITIERQGRK